MHRILQTLHQLLEVRDPRLERLKAILSRIDAGSLIPLIGPVGPAPSLADAGDQTVKLEHGSAPVRALGRIWAAGIPPTLFLCHLADHERTVPDLLTHHFELLLVLLLGSLPGALHAAASPGRTIETILFGQPWPCLVAPAIETDDPSALTTQMGT
jgi:hypothetical protein